MTTSELGFEQSLAMTQSVGDAFPSAYLPMVEKARRTAYGERERDLQLYRYRSRPFRRAYRRWDNSSRTSSPCSTAFRDTGLTCF